MNGGDPYIRGGSNHKEDPDLLRGVLARDVAVAVYPEDSCLMCLREGKTKADEKCFHRHWLTTDAAPASETRDSINN